MGERSLSIMSPNASFKFYIIMFAVLNGHIGSLMFDQLNEEFPHRPRNHSSANDSISL